MELQVQKKYFDAILNNTKIYEWRIAKDKYRNLKIGDKIIFKTDWISDVIVKEVTSLHIFWSFFQAWQNLWVYNILPGIETIEEMVSIYRDFYWEDEESVYNVVMIWL